jgi:pimeloyl-ACP methyl ester carboxylesterase
MTRARLNDVEIEYTVTGHGPAVLMTHGYGDTNRTWDAQREALSRYRLITADLRGHGETESPADPAAYSLPATVADLRALLHHLGVERAVVGGLSLGGYVSLAFSLAHPEMVRALVICDSGPGFRNAEARAAWNERAHGRAVRLEKEGVAALGSSRAAREIARDAGADAPPDDPNGYVPRHRSAQGLAHAARGMLAQTGPEVIDGLPRIAVPTLIIVGDRDEPFLAPSAYMAKKIPGARLKTIPGAGHLSNVDQPDAFNRVLLDFLDSLPGA